MGRAASAVGATAGVAYLTWRATRSLHGVSPWAGVPALLAEAAGIIATLVLMWGLWTGPSSSAGAPAVGFDDLREPVTVMVTSAQRDLPWLRATTLAARELGPITVVDLVGRVEVCDFAEREGLAYLLTDVEDLNGLTAMADACTTPVFLLLDAGDVPHRSIVARLRPYLGDGSVAIAQAVGASASVDSAEHTQSGRHLRDVDRRALNPALSRRGLAMFLGSGALVRTSAIRGVEPGLASPPLAQAMVTASLLATGSRVVSAGPDPLVALDPLLLADDVERTNAREASAARQLLIGEHGALRGGGLTFEQRLGLAVWAIRPLSGVRRSIVVALVLEALLAGRLPLAFSLPAITVLWVPWLVGSSLGLFLLSGRTMRPGDRSRESFRSLGTSWRGLLAHRGRPANPRRAVAGAFGLEHSVAPTAAIAVISVVLGLRGLSDRFTHTLAPLPGRQLAALLVVALWSLWSALDALRLLARRTQSRRARRVSSSLPCTMLDHAALIVDLTPLGAGVLSDVEAAPGSSLRLEVVLPTNSGCTTASIPAVVRNARLDFSGGHRLGVQFGEVDAYVAETLAEYCLVQPGLDVLGPQTTIVRTEVRPVVVVDPEPAGPRRLGLRAAALLAVAGALASAAPRPAEAATTGIVVRGRVVASGQPVVGAVALLICSTAPGADDRWGTSDDVFVSPATDVTGADGAYSFDASGVACWAQVAMPAGELARRADGELGGTSAALVVDLPAGRVQDVFATAAATPPVDAAASVSIASAVFADLDGDGRRSSSEPGIGAATITIYDPAGGVLVQTVSGPAGAFDASVPDGTAYRIGVSDVRVGWATDDPTGISDLRVASAGHDGAPVALRDRVVVAAAAAAASSPAPLPFERFPTPAASELADAAPTAISSGVASIVIALAGLIAASVLVGTLLPMRRREIDIDTTWTNGQFGGQFAGQFGG